MRIVVGSAICVKRFSLPDFFNLIKQPCACVARYNNLSTASVHFNSNFIVVIKLDNYLLGFHGLNSAL